MKISKLTINNFRCIKEQTLDAKELSIFIGDNATGKTSIIEAVNFAFSPYFFKNCLKNSQIELLITKNSADGIVVESTGSQFGLFPWSPSWGEINYSAYGLPTIEFHNELYGYIQKKQQKYTIDQVETYFVGKSVTKSKKWTKTSNGRVQQPEDVTLLTFVRNSIHHPENMNNGGYTPQELKSSIDEMIKLIKNP